MRRVKFWMDKGCPQRAMPSAILADAAAAMDVVKAETAAHHILTYFATARTDEE